MIEQLGQGVRGKTRGRAEKKWEREAGSGREESERKMRAELRGREESTGRTIERDWLVLYVIRHIHLQLSMTSSSLHMHTWFLYSTYCAWKDTPTLGTHVCKRIRGLQLKECSNRWIKQNMMVGWYGFTEYILSVSVCILMYLGWMHWKEITSTWVTWKSNFQIFVIEVL